MGPSFQVAPEAATLTAFTLDATGGASILTGLLGGAVFNGELGYSFDSRGDDLHAFNLTAGMGYGNVGVGVTIQPRLIIGRQGDEFAVGMRNGLVMRAMADMFSLEVSHRFLHHQGPLQHDMQMLLGVNPGAVVYLVSRLNNMF